MTTSAITTHGSSSLVNSTLIDQSFSTNSERNISASPQPKTLRSRIANWWIAKFTARSQAKALRMFKCAARNIPAYQHFLANHNIDPSKVTTIQDFIRHVPNTDKVSLFARYPLHELCQNGVLKNASSLYTSSGYSGIFSFGIDNPRNCKMLQKQTDRLLNWYFQTRKKNTLIVNALPAGVKIPSKNNAILDVSTRPKAVIAALKHLAPAFTQTIIVAEHPFLKEVLEKGTEENVSWHNLVIHLITGAEVMPENFRRYAATILGHNSECPDNGQVGTSLGISEVSLSLGQETPATQRLRSAIHDCSSVRNALFNNTPFAPTLVHFHPLQHFIETPNIGGRPTLVVTTLDTKRQIPLIRYNTGDWAQIIEYQTLKSRLTQLNRLDLLPDLPLPLLAMWGRGNSFRTRDNDIYPEQVKEALYVNPDIASRLTGNFKIQSPANSIQIDFQLRYNASFTPALTTTFQEILTSYLGFPTIVTFSPLRNQEFPDYQNKFQYV